MRTSYTIASVPTLPDTDHTVKRALRKSHTAFLQEKIYLTTELCSSKMHELMIPCYVHLHLNVLTRWYPQPSFAFYDWICVLTKTVRYNYM